MSDTEEFFIDEIVSLDDISCFIGFNSNVAIYPYAHILYKEYVIGELTVYEYVSRIDNKVKLKRTAMRLDNYDYEKIYSPRCPFFLKKQIKPILNEKIIPFISSFDNNQEYLSRNQSLYEENKTLKKYVEDLNNYCNEFFGAYVRGQLAKKQYIEKPIKNEESFIKSSSGKAVDKWEKYLSTAVRLTIYCLEEYKRTGKPVTQAEYEAERKRLELTSMADRAERAFRKAMPQEVLERGGQN